MAVGDNPRRGMPKKSPDHVRDVVRLVSAQRERVVVVLDRAAYAAACEVSEADVLRVFWATFRSSIEACYPKEAGCVS
jgi:hypothetical protein